MLYRLTQVVFAVCRTRISECSKTHSCPFEVKMYSQVMTSDETLSFLGASTRLTPSCKYSLYSKQSVLYFPEWQIVSDHILLSRLVQTQGLTHLIRVIMSIKTGLCNITEHVMMPTTNKALCRSLEDAGALQALRVCAHGVDARL